MPPPPPPLGSHGPISNLDPIFIVQEGGGEFSSKFLSLVRLHRAAAPPPAKNLRNSQMSFDSICRRKGRDGGCINAYARPDLGSLGLRTCTGRR